jgi:hypothetical protein
MDEELDDKLARAVVGEKKDRTAKTAAVSAPKLTGKKAKSLRYRK